ncbi:MAG: hypothetical protein HY861_04980 [Chlamydiia bacterium]|nr:hypothetical protein [Chlamydiia bacterium]
MDTGKSLSLFNTFSSRIGSISEHCMLDAFKICVDRLLEGQVQKIEGSFDPSFLEVDEEELKFRAPVFVRGEVYAADQHLVVHLNASTYATMPCAICNELGDWEIKIDNFYHTEPLSEIKGAVFDLGPQIREALLLELPSYVECGQGKCPHRALIAPYLQKTEKPKDNEMHFPFSGL